MDNFLKQQFLERTQKHIESVNEFAAKIGKQYPNHDSSKLVMLLEGYKYFMIPQQDLTEDQKHALDIATLMHIKSAPHHPEYWTSTDLTGFTRTNCCPNGPIDATDMPEEFLEQMVCDWAAMSKEYGKNTPMEWFESVNGKRWIFTSQQQEFIRQTIDKVWND
jgi:hypothetical protein